MNKSKIDTYRNNSDFPLIALSVLFIAIFVLSNFHVPFMDQYRAIFSSINWVIWFIFLMDYLVMFSLSPNKIRFFRRHLLDLLLVILPFLRILRVIRVGTLFFRKMENIRNSFVISIPVFTVASAILFVLLGASAVYDSEYLKENSNIKTPSDAIWWAIVTIFTVGYGDKFPISSEGRIYATGLMICGIAVVGSVTATFAAWFVSQVREVESEQKLILEKLDEVIRKLGK